MPSSKDPIINRQKAREYAIANPEWKRKSAREYMRRKRADPNRRQLLVDARNRYREANKEKVQAATTKWARDKRPGYWLFKNAQYRARALGLPFDLKWEDIKIPEVCPVLGIAIVMPEGRKGFNPNSPSLDRLIPALGYTRDNVRVISVRANTIKRDATLGEIEAIAAYIRRETIGW